MTLTIDAVPVPLKTDAHGVVRVDGTRVTLDTVVTAFKEGTAPEEIIQQYPTLDLADVYAVINFYLHRRSEVDEYLRERQQQADAARAYSESRHDPTGIRERLLARKMNPEA